MKYTDLARLAPQCFGCRQPPEEGELVLAHRNRNGWGMLFGRGIKSLSLAGAILCPECHTYGDGPGRTDYSWWEMAVQRTLTWAWKEGYIEFNWIGGVTPGVTPDKALR